MPKSDLDQKFLESQKLALIERREMKKKVLQQKGDLAAIHLPESLAQIRQALGRIKRGTYGLCKNCGDGIETRSLRIKPEISFCWDCTELMKEDEISLRQNS